MTDHCIGVSHQSFKVVRKPHHFHYHPVLLLVLITATIIIAPYPSPVSLGIYAECLFDIILQLELCLSVLNDKPLNAQRLEEGEERW